MILYIKLFYSVFFLSKILCLILWLGDSVIARFSGSQYLLGKPIKTTVTLAEEIHISFRTRFAFGSLLLTKSSNRMDSVHVFLYNTNLYIKYNTSDFKEVGLSL